MDIKNVSKSCPNYTFNETADTCLLKKEDVTLITCYVIVFFVGVIGNSIILIVVGPRCKSGPNIDILIAYLALFDLLASVFGPFVFLYWLITCEQTWHFGIVGCKILPTLSRIFTDISIGVILIMAIDRCRAIVVPLKEKFSRRTIHVAVAVTVVMSVLCEAHYINALEIDPQGYCMVLLVTDPTYSYPLVVLTMLRNTIFITIFSITTILIYAKICKSNESTKLLCSNVCQNRTRSARVMQMLVVMAVVFAISVMPRDAFHLAYTISWMDSSKVGIPCT